MSQTQVGRGDMISTGIFLLNLCFCFGLSRHPGLAELEGFSKDRKEKQDCLLVCSSGLTDPASLLSGKVASLSQLLSLSILRGSCSSLSTSILTSPTRLPSTCLRVERILNLCLPLALIFSPAASPSPSWYWNISAVVPTTPAPLLLSSLHLRLTTPNVLLVSMTLLRTRQSEEFHLNSPQLT